MPTSSNTVDARTRALPDGNQIPLLGLGVWHTAAGYGIGGILLATLAFAGLAGSSRDPVRPPCAGFHQNRPLRAG